MTVWRLHILQLAFVDIRILPLLALRHLFGGQLTQGCLRQ
jgi:hypothetical protein